MISPKGSKKIIVEMLGNIEILLMTSDKQFKLFLDLNNLGGEGIYPGEGSYKGQAGQIACKESGVSYFYIAVKNGCEMRTVVHESVHMATFILEHVGISFGTGNESEALAYLTDFLTQKVCAEVRPHA